MLRLLRIPVFQRLFTANLINLLGNEFAFIAVVGLLHELSGSGLSFAAGTVFRLLPYVVTSFFSGPLLERWQEHITMSAANLLRAGLTLLFFLVTEPSLLWLAFLVLAALNVCAALFTPAMQVSVTRSVPEEDRLQANSLIQGSTALMMLISQGIAALFISLMGYRTLFWLVSVFYLASLWFLWRVRIEKGEERVQEPFFDGLRKGFLYIWHNQPIRRQLFIQMAERMAAPYYILLMFAILNERGYPLYVFGLLDIPLGLGGILAGTVVGRLSKRLGNSESPGWTGMLFFLMGTSIFFMFLLPHLAVTVICSFTASFASFAIVITSITRIQQVADDHYLARVFSAREMLAMGTICLSCLFIGFGTEHWSSLEVGYVLAGWSLLSGIVLVTQIAGKKNSQEYSLGGNK